MSAVDLDATVDVAIICYGDSVKNDVKSDLLDSLKQDYCYYKPTTFIAKKDGCVIALLQVTPVNIHPNTVSISWLGVLKEYSRYNITESIISFAESHTMKNIFKYQPGMFIAVATVNDRLYRRFGYKVSNLNSFSGYPYIYKNYQGDESLSKM